MADGRAVRIVAAVVTLLVLGGCAPTGTRPDTLSPVERPFPQGDTSGLTSGYLGNVVSGGEGTTLFSIEPTGGMTAYDCVIQGKLPSDAVEGALVKIDPQYPGPDGRWLVKSVKVLEAPVAAELVSRLRQRGVVLIEMKHDTPAFPSQPTDLWWLFRIEGTTAGPRVWVSHEYPSGTLPDYVMAYSGTGGSLYAYQGHAVLVDDRPLTQSQADAFNAVLGDPVSK